MNWAWATSLDQFWRTPAFPMWLTLIAAGFFAVIVLITLLRAEKSVANGALTVITLLAIGIAFAATFHSFGPDGIGPSADSRSAQPVSIALPALSCIDDLAGETVLTACEKALFGSAESAAAALSYAAAQVTRLIAFGDVAAANGNASPDLQMLRRAVERDRYGLVAYVLMARDHCSPSQCAAFAALTDRNQIVANMNERVYDGLVARYASQWNALPPPPAAVPVAALSTPGASGKPTNADFPSAASTPPVSIMTPEPAASPPPAAPRPPPSTPLAIAPLPSPRPPPAASPPPATAKKQAAPKSSPKPGAAVQLAPPAAAPATPAPAADND